MISIKAQAIETALIGDWNNAIILNQLLLDEDPGDIDTLNRLAFAHASQGNSKEAKDLYSRVLELDMQNPIALRNLKRLNNGTSQATGQAPNKVNNIFIEESGKTKVIDLRNEADRKVVDPLRSGEFLLLNIKRSKIFVLNSQKVYIGMLPDDISQRMIKFIEGGNEYEAYVKTVENNKVTVFIKETKRDPKFTHEPSFVSNTTKLSFSNKQKGHASSKQERSDDLENDKDQDSGEESL